MVQVDSGHTKCLTPVCGWDWTRTAVQLTQRKAVVLFEGLKTF